MRREVVDFLTAQATLSLASASLEAAREAHDKAQRDFRRTWMFMTSSEQHAINEIYKSGVRNGIRE